MMVDILGPMGRGREINAASLYATANGGPGSASNNEIVIKGLNREIERIQGFRVQMSIESSTRLKKIREQVQQIDRSNPPVGLRKVEQARRLDLMKEAYQILGKTYVDVDNDTTLSDIKKKIDTLLEPPLRGEKASRLQKLRREKTRLNGEMLRSPQNGVYRSQFLNVNRQIESLVPARLFSELTLTERRQYDGLVESANAYAGTEVFLSSAKQLKIQKLQRTIARLKGQ